MKRGFVFIILAMMVVVSCTAQNQNNERNIVGTWIDNNGSTWVFKADGTFTVSGNDNGEGRFTGTQLWASWRNPSVFNISLSSDGKTMILSRVDGSGYLLIKK